MFPVSASQEERIARARRGSRPLPAVVLACKVLLEDDDDEPTGDVSALPEKRVALRANPDTPLWNPIGNAPPAWAPLSSAKSSAPSGPAN